MYEMFNSASDFNQDLTDWCVNNITPEPENFSINSALTNQSWERVQIRHIFLYFN